MRRFTSWRSHRPGAPASAPRQAAALPAVRVLGLDPGSRITGFGIVDIGASGPTYVASGAIRAGTGDFTRRLQDIYAGVAAVVAEYRPAEIAIERVFIHRNPDSALKLGQARGAALSATFGHDAPLFEYTPREVKLGVVGTGAADKEQVQRMVTALLGLDGRLAPDAADALAIALCHAHGRSMRLALAAAADGAA
ncbi:MAG TPA: crossover junction endodeoxyribonuclease RuvC [Steroidobacteraceae bacterium]|nr:crossover junction endodeoxyribonuclease RuvC [Steroidobacteraceae bacterium]